VSHAAPCTARHGVGSHAVPPTMEIKRSGETVHARVKNRPTVATNLKTE
jgi:hypothetical protein